MKKTNSQKLVPQISEEQVIDYLESHPDFFSDKDDLLADLIVPHKQDQTVSLVERQVSLLRERSMVARHKLDEFVASAKENNEIFEKSRRLILEMIEAQDPDQFFSALEKSFKQDFGCHAYSLIIFSDRPHQINHFTTSVSEVAAREFIGSLIRARQPTLGILRPAEQDFLFRHQSEKVKSAAVLSVRKNRQIALLAIGNEDANYFKPGMGTVFISFIADALAQLIPKHIYLKHQ